MLALSPRASIPLVNCNFSFTRKKILSSSSSSSSSFLCRYLSRQFSTLTTRYRMRRIRSNGKLPARKIVISATMFKRLDMWWGVAKHSSISWNTTGVPTASFSLSAVSFLGMKQLRSMRIFQATRHHPWSQETTNGRTSSSNSVMHFGSSNCLLDMGLILRRALRNSITPCFFRNCATNIQL